MFLKQVEMQGFKSFADHTVVTFESDYTGIVGPNGCGKSNITDAIKWVLGETSAKQLRGTQMSDVIFSGAEGKRGVNMAEVTLSFDNSRHNLNSDYTELEVTRRLYKNTGESEYLINNQPCRLRDIQDLVLDSGIGHDSLSMISQGNIQSFAEAKPIDRRGLFEEAAGVAKYKKRKVESLNKLARTQDNIDRLQDIINELEKQVSPLARQARKAQIFQEKKKKLTSIEVAVIVNDIKNLIADLESVDQEIADYNYQDGAMRVSIQMLEDTVNELKEEITALDKDVNLQQDKLLKVLNEIQTLEKRKVEIDEKRRYIQQTASIEEKIAETKNLMEAAKLEFDDRSERVAEKEAEIDLLAKRVEDYTIALSKLQPEIEESNSRYAHLSNRKAVLDAALAAPYQHQAGVKAVLSARNVLEGIYGTVSDLISVDEGYQLAISTALAGAVYHIVTKNDECARNAIQFLKRNKSGQATFLPLNVMRARTVNDDILLVAENTEGFLGLASDFVECEERFDSVILNLLGNTFITNDLKQANELARRTKHQFKIVTIDGDVILRGGAMSGGYNRTTESPVTLKSQLEEVERQIAAVRDHGDSLISQYNRLNRLKNDDSEAYNNARVALSSLNEVLAVKRSKYENLKAEYDRIKPQDGAEEQSFADELITNLNNAYRNKDEITAEISAKRSRRAQATNEESRKQSQLRQQRQALAQVSDKKNRVQMDRVRIVTNRDNLIERLGREYEMTYEFAVIQDYQQIDLEAAKEEVRQLRSEIAALGNVNLDAPADYEEVNGRYEFMCKQMNDLVESKEKLLAAIDDMDEVMTKQFKETFDLINKNLSEVFTVLFGGGKAKLVLEDPNDILNTGIDIDVQPPGKAVQNIRLFSGGEKALIAICVLFAILKARPVPLCIFDEIEASLDQGNVDRFARYIHHFSSDSQFIVITHRPGTMQECDVLYGITMMQKGVSKVIKVKLKEALTYAQSQEDTNGAVQ